MFSVLNNVLAGVLLLIAVPLSAAGLPPLTHGLTQLDNPEMAPDFRLKNLDDEWVSLSAFRGKTVVVNFWATWCPPCRREMPSLQRMYQKLEKEGVIVLAVNIAEDIETVFSFFGSLETIPTFPILFDEDSEVLQQWRVRGLPTTYVVSPLGKVVYRAIGGREFDHPDVLLQLKALGTNRTGK